MPEYLYQHPESEEVISVIQGMNEEHKFIDDQGIEWKRIFLNPTMSIDSQSIDPFSEQQFMEKTANMKGTVGDMMDYSKELSRQRAEQRGNDPVKTKMFDDYKKKTGVKHMKDKPEKKSFENKYIKVDY